MITCYIRYTLDPFKIADFQVYARRWLAIIPRCGGDLLGYWMPKEGINNIALAMIDFKSLAAYEIYRDTLKIDPEGAANFAFAEETRCILKEERTFLTPVRK